MSTVSIIAAIAKNNVIGNRNQIPWYLPADLAHFKALTLNHSVIMGRKTYESIITRLGKPLPERQNIVVTSQPNFQAPGCVVAHSLTEALEKISATDEIFIIGGASLYITALSIATRLYLTEVDAEIPGDTFFPAWNKKDWQLEKEIFRSRDEKNPYDIIFRDFKRA